MSSRSSVDRAPARCSGGHGFDSCRGLRIFLCPTLVSCRLIHLHIIIITFICHTIIEITNNMGKVEKKWRGDLTETMGAYERLELFKIKRLIPLPPLPLKH